MNLPRSADVSLLIDSNIFIAAEEHGADGHSYGPQAAELLRLAGRLHYPVMLSHGTRSDLLRAKPGRRERRRRQLDKYNVLDQVPLNMDAARQGEFPTVLNDNTRADLEVLSTFLTGVADWLITNDATLRRRARRCGAGEMVLSLDEALDTLHPLISLPSTLPAVDTVQGYTIPLSAPIFETLRASYPPAPGDPGFDRWWHDKVAGQHRDVIILGGSKNPEGLAVLKPEDDHPHGLPVGVLKICTFKVSDDFQGTKRGELMLKAVIDYARRNGREHLYVEVMPDAVALLGWLDDFGFRALSGASTPRDEVALVKDLAPLSSATPLSPLAHNIAYGPGSVLVERAHVVPIKDDWHHWLLPEADRQQDLFPGIDPCGNAIRKAYLCRANTGLVQPGNLLLFLRTGSGKAHITSVGVVEDILRSQEPAAVVRFVGSRTVYTATEIAGQCSRGPVLAIRFRLDRVLAQPWTAEAVRSHNVMNGTAQTIARVPKEGVLWLRKQLAEWR